MGIPGKGAESSARRMTVIINHRRKMLAFVIGSVQSYADYIIGSGIGYRITGHERRIHGHVAVKIIIHRGNAINLAPGSHGYFSMDNLSDDISDIDIQFSTGSDNTRSSSAIRRYGNLPCSSNPGYKPGPTTS
jgi:hypothetical protein